MKDLFWILTLLAGIIFLVIVGMIITFGNYP